MTEEEQQRQENLAAMAQAAALKKLVRDLVGAAVLDVKFEGTGVVKRAGVIIQQGEDERRVI